jgi:hypothetical protein
VQGTVVVAVSDQIDPLATDRQWRIVSIALNKAFPMRPTQEKAMMPGG